MTDVIPTSKHQARDTAIQCLISLAHRYGIDLQANSIIETYGLDKECNLTDLVRIASDADLKIELRRMKWRRLRNLGDRFPCMARLKNGNTVIFSGITQRDGQEQIVVKDPLDISAGFIFLTREQLEKSWDGEIIFLTPVSPVSDTDQSFGLWWFRRELSRYRAAFSSIFICSFFINIFALVTPFFFMIVIDKAVAHHGIITLNTLGLGAIIVLLFDALFEFFKNYFLGLSVRGIDNNLMIKVFAYALSLPIDFFEHYPRGVVVKYMQEAEKIRQFLTGRLFSLSIDLIFVILFVVILFTLDTTLALISAFTGILLLAISMVTAPLIRSQIRDLFTAGGHREALLIETISGMNTIKTLALEKRQRRQWEAIIGRITLTRYQLHRLVAASKTIVSFIEKTQVIIIIWVGSWLAMEGKMTIGALVAANILARRVSTPLAQLANLLEDFQETMVSVRMLGTIMNHQPEQVITKQELLTPAIRGRIDIEGVTFCYPNSDSTVLKDVSLSIPAGTMVGLVGRSGSGKSTLTRLLLGLYPLKTGSIRFDSYDIREIKHSYLRSSIGTVIQDNLLFRGTIGENIAVGADGATFEKVIWAARQAGADEFIQRLPKRYETLLDEAGTNLSTGQRQRIALARALVRDPTILILDEATSALDPESEAIIKTNLAQIRRGRTVIMISHRLSMLTDTNFIIVLDRGNIVDVGRHHELTLRCAVYRKLWHEQIRQAG